MYKALQSRELASAARDLPLCLFHKFSTFIKEPLGAGGLKVQLMGLTPFRIRELLFETTSNGNSKAWWEKRASGKCRQRERAKMESTRIV